MGSGDGDGNSGNGSNDGGPTPPDNTANEEFKEAGRDKRESKTERSDSD